MQIYEVLVKNHENLRRLLKRIEELRPSDSKARRSFLRALRTELLAHTKAEETAFYSQIEPVGPTHELALEAIEEHRLAEEILESLEDLDPTDDGWEARFHVLKENLELHIHEVENALIPAARAVVSDEDAEEMSDEFEEIREEMIDELRMH